MLLEFSNFHVWTDSSCCLQSSAVLLTPVGFPGSTLVLFQSLMILSGAGKSSSAGEWCWVFCRSLVRFWSKKHHWKYLWMAVQYSLPQANHAAETHFTCLTEASLSVCLSVWKYPSQKLKDKDIVSENRTSEWRLFCDFLCSSYCTYSNRGQPANQISYKSLIKLLLKSWLFHILRIDEMWLSTVIHLFKTTQAPLLLLRKKEPTTLA